MTKKNERHLGRQGSECLENTRNSLISTLCKHVEQCSVVMYTYESRGASVVRKYQDLCAKGSCKVDPPLLA